MSIDIYGEQLDVAGGDRGLQYDAALVGTGKPFGIAKFGQDTFDNVSGANAERWGAGRSRSTSATAAPAPPVRSMRAWRAVRSTSTHSRT